MTKKELSQLYYLNREIRQQKARLKQLESQASGSAICYTGMPHSTKSTDQTSNLAAEIADLKSLIELNIQKCWYERNRMERYIQAIDDSLMRQIMRFRYMDGMSWQRIAFEIGTHDESVPRQKHDKFLRRAPEKTELPVI